MTPSAHALLRVEEARRKAGLIQARVQHLEAMRAAGCDTAARIRLVTALWYSAIADLAVWEAAIEGASYVVAK